jgi:hypothetical protein
VVEHWLRDHIIRHFPGAAALLSELLELPVCDATGQQVGTIVDIRWRSTATSTTDPMTLTGHCSA